MEKNNNGDLISRSELLKFPIRRDHYDKENGNRHFIDGIETVFEYVETLPTVDAVEVVRCGGCRFCKTFYPEKPIDGEAIQVWFCELYRCKRKPDEFCSDGERRTE